MTRRECGPRRRSSVARASAATALAASLVTPIAIASSSADELVRQARAHEAEHDDDVAVRRYMEALAIEPGNAAAWLGLGALRMKIGEAAEAERVYSSALDRVPSLQAALEGRARARWAMGRHDAAEADLCALATMRTAQASVPALLELAEWYAADGRAPAALAVWRRLRALAVERSDGPSELVAGRMVRALVILVDGADPASSPLEPAGATRHALAAIARRGG